MWPWGPGLGRGCSASSRANGDTGQLRAQSLSGSPGPSVPGCAVGAWRESPASCPVRTVLPTARVDGDRGPQAACPAAVSRRPVAPVLHADLVYTWCQVSAPGRVPQLRLRLPGASAALHRSSGPFHGRCLRGARPSAPFSSPFSVEFCVTNVRSIVCIARPLCHGRTACALCICNLCLNPELLLLSSWPLCNKLEYFSKPQRWFSALGAELEQPSSHCLALPAA